MYIYIYIYICAHSELTGEHSLPLAKSSDALFPGESYRRDWLQNPEVRRREQQLKRMERLAGGRGKAPARRSVCLRVLFLLCSFSSTVIHRNNINNDTNVILTIILTITRKQ